MADNSLSGYEASNKRSALVVLAANQKPIFDKPPYSNTGKLLKITLLMNQ